jgi:hypothetical protein
MSTHEQTSMLGTCSASGLLRTLIFVQCICTAAVTARIVVGPVFNACHISRDAVCIFLVVPVVFKYHHESVCLNVKDLPDCSCDPVHFIVLPVLGM